MKLELIGGPYDGLTRTIADPPSCMWVTGPLEAPRCYRSPEEDRVPYFEVVSARSAEEQREDRLDSYLYGGNSHVLCSGCGAFHALRDEDGAPVASCGLCGTEFAREFA